MTVTSKNRNFFIMVLTKKIFNDEERYLKKVDRAFREDKPIYLIIHRDVEPDSFIHFPWRLRLDFDDDREFDRALRRIYEDFTIYTTAQEIK
jgi:hypothetical protein